MVLWKLPKIEVMIVSWSFRFAIYNVIISLAYNLTKPKLFFYALVLDNLYFLWKTSKKIMYPAYIVSFWLNMRETVFS